MTDILRTIDGVLAETKPRPCGDCGAKPGEEHLDGCDVARCLYYGDQRISCGVLFGDPGKPHNCGRGIWTGLWPGEAECGEFGWHSYFAPCRGWIRCDRSHPEARPDLNRLAIEARWDRLACRWRRPGDPVDDTAYVHSHLDRGYALEPTALYTLDGAHVRGADLAGMIAGRQLSRPV